jgi:cardiolipin synthase
MQGERMCRLKTCPLDFLHNRRDKRGKAMIKKKSRLLSLTLTFAVLLTITAGAFSSYAETLSVLKDGSYPAKVKDISDRKYFPEVKQALSEAKESIFMVMFVVGLRPYDKTSKVYQLVDELVKAHQRGVKVTVILDQNIDFVDRNTDDEWQVEGKNAWCFKVLKDAGVTVWYDSPTKYTHSKVIVIDEETVITGSANWTQTALSRSFESNSLIKSKELAAEFLKRFREIEIDKKASNLPVYLEVPVPVSWKFMEKPNLAGEMMSRHDERSLDLYLLLLKDFDGNPEAKIILDYDKTAESLGIYEKMSRLRYREQILRSLRKLESRYNLIRVKSEYAKDAQITLLSYDNPNKVYSYPREWYFQVPAVYWTYGWDKKLPMRARFCYLINLAYAGVSDAKPWWCADVESLSKRFNVKKRMISQGMQELRRLNLIDVEYPPLGKEGPLYPLAKSYKVLRLYDPAWLEGEWDRLELLYGKNNLKKARDFARIVYEENDPHQDCI